MSEYENTTIASWTVGQEGTIRFPVKSVGDTMRNRIIAQERPYRDGGKLDDTGAKVREFVLACIFSNKIDENGLSDNGLPLFPDMLTKLQASFNVHETGLLVLPTIGGKRCKAVALVRRDTAEDPDGPNVDLVFHEDNEDSLDRALLDNPTIKGSIPQLAEQTVFSAQASGSWDEGLSSIESSVGAVENALNAPGRATNEVSGLAKSSRRIAARVVKVQKKFADDLSRPFSEPSGSQTERQLLTLRDRQAEAAAERARSLPAIRIFKVDVEVTSLFEVAARFGQDISDLLDLNDALLPTPFLLRKGDVVRVFATAPT